MFTSATGINFGIKVMLGARIRRESDACRVARVFLWGVRLELWQALYVLLRVREFFRDLGRVVKHLWILVLVTFCVRSMPGSGNSEQHSWSAAGLRSMTTWHLWQGVSA